MYFSIAIVAAPDTFILINIHINILLTAERKKMTISYYFMKPTTLPEMLKGNVQLLQFPMLFSQFPNIVAAKCQNKQVKSIQGCLLLYDKILEYKTKYTAPHLTNSIPVYI